MNLFKQYEKTLQNNRKLVLNLMAAGFVLQGITMAQFILKVSKIASQADFLADIVGRNMDRLEEFDLIALRELGLIKPIQNN